jgi:SAM-dependent methyltransferase
MENGWDDSAKAWITDMGEYGDFGRRYVLDPVMLPLALKGCPVNAIDIGCGEGRFCRMLRRHGVDTTGVDPTAELLATARHKDPDGIYVDGMAENLPFANDTFDLAVSYLSLVDVPDIRKAIPEMARVLMPGGRLLIANLNSFNSACADRGWVKDAAGNKVHFPVDRYLEERAMWVAWRGIRILNHHRPLSLYMRLLLEAGLELIRFDEPRPIDGAPQRAEDYGRVPWFLVMEWRKRS